MATNVFMAVRIVVLMVIVVVVVVAVVVGGFFVFLSLKETQRDRREKRKNDARHK